MDFTASIDEMEQGLLAREHMISMLRQQQAEILTTLDAMQVNQLDGASSLQEWVRGRLDVSSQTARDLVDAGRQLHEGRSDGRAHSDGGGAVAFESAADSTHGTGSHSNSYSPSSSHS